MSVKRPFDTHLLSWIFFAFISFKMEMVELEE